MVSISTAAVALIFMLVLPLTYPHEITYGICYVQQSYQQSYTYYVQSSYLLYAYEYTSHHIWDEPTLTSTVAYTTQAKTGYNTAYQTVQTCCSGYGGDDCAPICSSGCYHGTCIEPEVCVCDEGYKGESCGPNDSNLRGWCDSITQSNMDDSLGSLATSNSPCGDSFDSASTISVGEKIAADVGRAADDTARETLYALWKEHPTVLDNCCFISEGQNATIKYLEKLMAFGDDLHDLVGALSDTVAIGLREELTTLCSTDDSHSFCSVNAVLPVTEILSQLPPKSDWTDETDRYIKAIMVSFVLVKEQHFKDLQLDEDATLIEALNIVHSLLQSNEISKLESFLTYLPPRNSFPSSEDQSCENDKLCLFGKVLDATRLLIEQQESESNENKLILNTAVNYRQLLEEGEVDVLFDVERSSMVSDIGSKLKKYISSDFFELQSYLKRVKSFNSEIGKGNIGYVMNQIEFFNKKIQTASPKVENGIRTILTSATGTEIASSSLQIASAFNPLLIVLNDEEFVEAITPDIPNTDDLQIISSSLVALKNKANAIGQKFVEDEEFFKSIRTLISKPTPSRAEINDAMSTFLDKQKQFTPRITIEELMESNVLWTDVVNATCNIVLHEASSSNESKTLCATTLSDEIEQMYRVYNELYHFQFELIATMASFMNALTSIDLANSISHDFSAAAKMSPDSSETDATLSILGSLSSMVHKMQTSKLIDMYCNILQYKLGGELPSDCGKGLGTNIPSLLAEKAPQCTSETHFLTYNVPTKPSFDGDMAYVDMNQLYSGGYVSFQIPSSQWLVDKNWIKDHEQDYAIYVQQLEVYLPIDVGEKVKTFQTHADSVVLNTITPSSATGDEATVFVITNNTPFVNEYQMSPDNVPCQLNNRKFKNPYAFCEASNAGQICGLSSMSVEKDLYPSIYSRWNLKVEGVENFNAPNPATNMNLIFGMKLCKIKNGYTAIDLDEFTKAQYMQPCCPEGQYRSHIEAICQDCPPDSYSALFGYYCEKTCKT